MQMILFENQPVETNFYSNEKDKEGKNKKLEILLSDFGVARVGFNIGYLRRVMIRQISDTTSNFFYMQYEIAQFFITLVLTLNRKIVHRITANIDERLIGGQIVYLIKLLYVYFKNQERAKDNNPLLDIN